MSATVPEPPPTVPPDALARRASAAMHRTDAFARHLGFTIESCRAGASRLSMVVRQEMVNGHDICHGGAIFTLADTALAHASNSYNDIAVAVTCNIEFIASAMAGDRLTATAEQRSRAGRNGIYDVSVVNQRGELVALFRGKTRTVGGAVVTDAQTGA